MVLLGSYRERLEAKPFGDFGCDQTEQRVTKTSDDGP